MSENYRADMSALTKVALSIFSNLSDQYKPSIFMPGLTSLALTVMALAGCSTFAGSNPEAGSSLTVEKEIPPLTRAEVIAGISECEKAGMRPIIINAKRKINNQMIPTVVEITCLPGFK